MAGGVVALARRSGDGELQLPWLLPWRERGRGRGRRRERGVRCEAFADGPAEFGLGVKQRWECRVPAQVDVEGPQCSTRSCSSASLKYCPIRISPESIRNQGMATAGGGGRVFYARFPIECA